MINACIYRVYHLSSSPGPVNIYILWFLCSLSVVLRDMNAGKSSLESCDIPALLVLAPFRLLPS